MMKRERNITKWSLLTMGAMLFPPQKCITEDVKTVVFQIILKETSTSNQAKLNSFSFLFS